MLDPIRVEISWKISTTGKEILERCHSKKHQDSVCPSRQHLHWQTGIKQKFFRGRVKSSEFGVATI